MDSKTAGMKINKPNLHRKLKCQNNGEATANNE